MKLFINGYRVFDHMMVSSYLRCYNYYFFKYMMGLSEPVYAEALTFGIMIHSALETWYNTKSYEAVQEAFLAEAENLGFNTTCSTSSTAARTIENGLNKLAAYCATYKTDSFVPIKTELEHFIPFTGTRISGKISSKKPITVTQSIPIYYLTHIDSVGKYGGDIAFLEHKTTSLYSTSPVLTSYCDSMQVKGYVWSLMDYYKLAKPTQGYIDLIFLKAKKVEDMFLRYPLYFDLEEIVNFKTFLSNVIGEILWKENLVTDFTIPTPARCAIYNKVCEYRDVCRMLPAINACKNFLETRGFIDTFPARLDNIKELGSEEKQPNTAYYTLKKGLTI